MKMYRKIILACFTLLVVMSHAAFAQSGKLKGQLIDEQGAAVPFANVAVMAVSDSALVTGAVTDAEGTFGIASPEVGSYFLRFSAIGYSTTYSKPFRVSGVDFSKTFPEVVLKEEAALLQEVTVEAMRPKVVVEADKMVVSVEGTAMAAGSSAFDVLSKSPGVWVDQDGNLQLNGKKGVEVMIDGRPTYLSAKALQTLLEGMSAENIKNIEIIANPSAKFDAEGTAGILNINLKKNTISGMNGSAYAGYEYNGLSFYNAGTNFNYKKGNWNSFASLDFAKRGRLRVQQMKRGFEGESGIAEFEQTGREVRERYLPSMRLGTEYALNDRHSIGLMTRLSFQDGVDDWNTLGQLNDYVGGRDVFIDARNHMEDASANGTLNLHYSGKLDSAGTTLSADLDYVRLGSEENSLFVNQYTYPDNNSTIGEELSSSSLSSYDIYAARIDLEVPVSRLGMLGLGAKASHVLSESQLRFYTHEGEVKEVDPAKSNDFIYKENIFAAYASLSSQLNDTWNLKAGLRAEKTMAEGYSLTLNQKTPRNYLNLFPSFFLQQKVSENYKLSYSYSRRISRPNYSKLNPFVFYIDPYAYVEGNPHLRPKYTHAFQITQTFLNTYNLVLGMDHSTDYFGEVPFQDPETKQTAFATRNMDNFRSYSATLMAPVQLLPTWSVNNNFVMAHQKYNMLIEGNEVENKQFFLMAQSNHQLRLPKDMMLEVNAAYRGPAAYGLYRIEGQWWMDAGLKRSLMADKLDVSLKVTDIFRTMQVIGSSEINGNTTAVDQYFGNRAFSLNLRFNFSKGEKFSSKSRKVELEELDRAGGN